MTVSVIIPLLAIALPACLGLFYFIERQRRERVYLTNALAAEMTRIDALLEHRLRWLDQPGSRELPLLPFETALYDAQVAKLGICDPRFAADIVSFYGVVHFLNALQEKQSGYTHAAGGAERFFNTYKKTVRRAIDHYANVND